MMCILQLDFIKIIRVYLAGTGINVLYHHGRIFNSHEFGRLPSGKHDSTSDYNLSQITAPVAIYYGNSDGLISTRVTNYVFTSNLF